MAKTVKVVFLAVLVAAIIVVGLGLATYYTVLRPLRQEEKMLKNDHVYLVLGDSIGEALIGPAPLSEKEDYGYHGIIGQINDYEFYNRAVSGAQTSDMIKFLAREEDSGVNLEYSLLRQADIIQVSILGNDFLQNHVDELFLELAKGDYSRALGIAEVSTVNFALIVGRLKEINPKATLLFQTVYNPYYDGTKLISAELLQSFEELNITDTSQKREIASVLIEILNNIVRDYAKDNPDTIVVVDVYEKFKKAYDKDNEFGGKLIAPDGVHPSAMGHAFIADVTQEVLVELGLAVKGEYTLNRYKRLKVNQINRLFKGTSVNVAEAKVKIESAKSFEEVTRAYFSAIEGETPRY